MSKKKQTLRKKRRTIKYTHSDRSGMPWRFVGGRPVSALADKVMMEVYGEKGLAR